MTNNIVSKDPNVLGGTPVFTGTRIPIAVLFENLADGLTLDEILDSYPPLTRKAALLALQEAEALLERDSLSGSALKGFFNITAKWGLKDECARELLGGVSSDTFNEWKKNPDGQVDLGEDCITRISILVGIYRSLHIVYGDKLADEWVNLPNRDEMFAGLSPIQFMVAGGLPALQAVRELLDARGGHPG